MKPAALPLFLAVLTLTSCTTVQNRRDLFSPQPVEGPYTRLLAERRGKPLMIPPAPVTAPAPTATASGKNVVPPVAD